MLRPGDSHNDQTDGLVQSYPQLDVLHLLCPLVHAVALIDVARAHDRRDVQKHPIYRKLDQCIADDVRGWLVSPGHLRQD